MMMSPRIFPGPNPPQSDSLLPHTPVRLLLPLGHTVQVDIRSYYC